MTKPQVMIVEDEAIVALDIQNRLSMMGYQVAAVASSGLEAIEKSRQVKPSLILMDIMLEGDMDGIDAAGTIREEQNIPVIYLTAYADEKTLGRAKVTEPFGYIIKPFEDRELNLTIEMALYKHQAENKILENQRWLSTTLNNLGEAVVTTDMDGRVQFLNPTAEKLLVFDHGAALGKELRSIMTLRSNSNGHSGQNVVDSILSGQMVFGPDEDFTLEGPSGRNIPVAGNAKPIINEKNRNIGTVVVFRDITKRKRAEIELQNSLERVSKTLEQTVGALMVMSEKRDPYTAGHQMRVAQLACAIARSMGVDPDRTEGIRVAGLLHDIGKIYVPAEILSKPARLTDMEMGIMKTHSEVGYEILKTVDFPWPVAEVVVQHHERIDGSGYPGKLKGGEILLESRIIAVADVVEAMSSHRPYRAALGLDLAMAEITKGRDLRYDKDAVDACLKLFNEDGFTFNT